MKVYTYNDKVLVNSANDKWLKEKEAPAGFVMNGSNATYMFAYNSHYLSWEGPSFPDGYDGNGKQCVILNNTESTPTLYYAMSEGAGGPSAINGSSLVTGTTTMLANPAGAASGYGKYLTMNFASEEAAREFMANASITILDP